MPWWAWYLAGLFTPVGFMGGVIGVMLWLDPDSVVQDDPNEQRRGT